MIGLLLYYHPLSTSIHGFVVTIWYSLHLPPHLPWSWSISTIPHLPCPWSNILLLPLLILLLLIYYFNVNTKCYRAINYFSNNVTIIYSNNISTIGLIIMTSSFSSSSPTPSSSSSTMISFSHSNMHSIFSCDIIGFMPWSCSIMSIQSPSPPSIHPFALPSIRLLPCYLHRSIITLPLLSPSTTPSIEFHDHCLSISPTTSIPSDWLFTLAFDSIWSIIQYSCIMRLSQVDNEA